MLNVPRRRFIQLGASASLAGWVALSGCSVSSSTSAGSTSALTPRLAPFVSGRRSVSSTGLPRRIAWANTNDAEIFVALGQGYSRAASDRGLEYLTANAGGDDAENITQIRNFLSRGVGGILIQPKNEIAQEPLMREALTSGIGVQGIITDPCTLQVLAPHRQIGFDLGKAAADYVVEHLGGEAEVCSLTFPLENPGLRTRNQGVRDGLATGGAGVRIVAEEPTRGSSPMESGHEQMLAIFQKHPGIKVVVGPDDVVVGAYRAIQSLGKLRDDMFFGGMDGDVRARDLVRKHTPFRVSFAFPWRLMGYTLGAFAADWIEGLEIPRALVANAWPLLDATDVDEYDSANADPRGLFADLGMLTTHLPLLGNVGYATRDVVWEGSYEL